MANNPAPPIVLFGYESSAFTWKARMALRLRQIPHTLVYVPSMMPRPVLLESFNLTYRKIPVLAIGKELYIDTSLILEAIEQLPAFPPSPSHPPLHPSAQHRTLARLLSSHYTDRPLFRLTCGIMPQAIWETSFGVDRAGLIGHPLDAQKLGAKIPRNLAGLDTYLSILEPLFTGPRAWTWFLGTETPTAGDVSLYYQLHWGYGISRGDMVEDLTAGGANDGVGEGMHVVFNADRYPGLWAWYMRVQRHFDALPQVESKVAREDKKAVAGVVSLLNAWEQAGPVPLLETGTVYDAALDTRNGLVVGARVSVAPDDTGRDDPTFGTLVGLSNQEVVIVPDLIDGRESVVKGVRVHFPRVGFVILPVKEGGRKEVKVTVMAEKAKL